MKALSLLIAERLLLACCLFTAITSTQCGFCPTGWELGPEQEKCFSLLNDSRAWDDAEGFCRNQTGHLAAITSEEELHYVHNLCANKTYGCWVGGRGINSSTGFDWTWSDVQTVWNNSLLMDKPSDNCSLHSGCSRLDFKELCTVVTRNLTLLGVSSCNITRAFLCTLNESSKCQLRSCHKEYNIILAVVSVFIFTTTCGVVVWLLLFRQTKKLQRSSSSASIALVPPSWKVFTFDELRSATKNFSEGNKLGRDSRSGGTYRGVLSDGSLVAVKRLKSGSFKWKKDFLSEKKADYRSLSEQEFLSEIGRIARYRHPNLVVVRGCCFKHGQKYIVYDFMANGSLDKWLHHLPRGARSLDWGMRMRIATTLAQGIAFLHDKVKPHVVHRDIRASNVLLDEEYRAHILGVGLAKFVPWEAMPERTVMAGTYGYLAPEFVYRNELTTKSDVYSFGVLLLELVSGRMPAQTVESVDWQSIFEWATPLVQARNFIQLLDPVISTIPDVGEIQKVVDLVYACTQHVPSMRPRMSYVVHQLQQIEAAVPDPIGANFVVGTSSEASEAIV